MKLRKVGDGFDWTGLGSCAVAGFGIISTEHSGFATRLLL